MRRHSIVIASALVAVAGFWFFWPSTDSNPESSSLSSGVEGADDTDRTAAEKAESQSSVPAASGYLPPVLQGSPSVRVPSAVGKGALDDLQSESVQKWVVKRDLGGGVTKLSEGRFFLGEENPELAAHAFLERFGEDVFGITPSSAGSVESIKEDATTQVRISLQANSLPIYGAVHSQTYDSDGNLIYVVSDPLPEQVPSSDPAVTESDAARLIQKGLFQYLGSKNRKGFDQSYPVSFFQAKGRLMYRLYNGALSLVYRYEFSLQSPEFGDMEAMVDAKLGSVVGIQYITRR